MPHRNDDVVAIEIVPLHSTFAAEVHGVDFSKDISPEVFEQIKQAITKVVANSYRPAEYYND